MIAFGLIALLLSSPSFPPPAQVPVTDALKCDWGVVTAIDGGRTTVTLKTDAGPVVYRIDGATPLFSADGKPATVSELRMGDRLRVYYLLDNGAHAVELDLMRG